LSQFHEEAGVVKMRGTGGEPFLRKDWDSVVTSLSDIGYKDIDITTNGMLISTYLEEKGGLPRGLSVLKVSLDTYDPERFKEITGGGDLSKVMSGVREAGKHTYTRANRVMLRSEMTPSEIERYVDFCRGLGVKQIQFLDLVHYENLGRNDKAFWSREFVAFPEFKTIVQKLYPEAEFKLTSDQFGVAFHRTQLSDGLTLGFKDSRFTMRDESCWTCPVFCQEGRCLIRIATDGNITFCPDYRGELPSFDAKQAFRDNSLPDKIQGLGEIVENSRRTNTIELFTNKHGLRLPEEY